MSTQDSEQPNIAEAIEDHLIAKESDEAFKRAMYAARRLGSENFKVGIDRRPCTQSPRYVGLRALPVIRTSSPAALCAEMANDRMGSDSY